MFDFANKGFTWVRSNDIISPLICDILCNPIFKEMKFIFYDSRFALPEWWTHAASPCAPVGTSIHQRDVPKRISTSTTYPVITKRRDCVLERFIVLQFRSDKVRTCLLLPFRWIGLRECKKSLGRPKTTRICEATHPQGWCGSINFRGISYLICKDDPVTLRSKRTTSVSRLECESLDLMDNLVPFEEEEDDVTSSLSLREHFCHPALLQILC